MYSWLDHVALLTDGNSDVVVCLMHVQILQVLCVVLLQGVLEVLLSSCGC